MCLSSLSRKEFIRGLPADMLVAYYEETERPAQSQLEQLDALISICI